MMVKVSLKDFLIIFNSNYAVTYFQVLGKIEEVLLRIISVYFLHILLLLDRFNKFCMLWKLEKILGETYINQ